MEKFKINCEVTHNHLCKTMTCSWLGGRVRLVEFFTLGMTYVVIDGDMKAKYEDLSIPQFVEKQNECQRIADQMSNVRPAFCMSEKLMEVSL